MKCAIMQPTYLPWAGYFSMIDYVDIFVFLEDVQFSRRSWQQRNRINFKGQEKWLTVPVKKTGLRNQIIKDVEIVNHEWKIKHFNLIKEAYTGAPYFKDIIYIFEKSVLNNTSLLLRDINIQFIQEVMKYLDINTKIIFSSTLKSEGKKSEYLLKICEELSAEEYISAPGSIEYIEEEGLFRKSNIKIQIFNTQVVEYDNFKIDDFIPYMSILDVIAYNGHDLTKKYLKCIRGEK